MYNDYFNQEWQITVIRLKSIFWAIHKLFWLRVIVCQKILKKIHNDNYWVMDDTISRMFLHVGDSAAVDRDWTVVILGLYVEETSESVDDIVDVEGSSVDDIVAVDALLGGDVVVEAIVVVGVVDCFDVVDDTPVDVVSAGDDENVVVVVVVVFVIDGVVWVVEGSMSPLQVRLSTILESSPIVIMIHFNKIIDNSDY